MDIHQFPTFIHCRKYSHFQYNGNIPQRFISIYMVMVCFVKARCPRSLPFQNGLKAVGNGMSHRAVGIAGRKREMA